MSLRAVIALEAKIGGLEWLQAERAEIHAALGALTQAVDTALLALARGELRVFLLSATVRANAAHKRLRQALDALTVALVERDRGARVHLLIQVPQAGRTALER